MVQIRSNLTRLPVRDREHKDTGILQSEGQSPNGCACVCVCAIMEFPLLRPGKGQLFEVVSVNFPTTVASKSVIKFPTT